jgi:glycerophosphoryl diester phosphodiesterase
MNDVNENSGFEILNIAHRGFSSKFPENTIEAFENSINIADGIELDVQLSKDNQVVVIHDETVDRTTDAKGFVKDFTAEELKQLNVPTLEEVLCTPLSYLFINIELKADIQTKKVSRDFLNKTLECVKKHKGEKEIVFSSFDLEILSELKKMEPGFNVALLYDEKALPEYRAKEFAAHAKKLHAGWIAFNQKYLNKTFVARLRDQSVAVGSYVVNDEKRVQELIEWGVTVIFTDATDVLEELITER